MNLRNGVNAVVALPIPVACATGRDVGTGSRVGSSRAIARPWRHRPARRLRRRVANKVPAAPHAHFNAVLDETRPSSRTHRNLSATGDRRFFCACNPVKENLHFTEVKSRFRELLSAPIRCSAQKSGCDVNDARDNGMSRIASLRITRTWK